MHDESNTSAWICPNDRHLALRAKLRSGWSVRTNQFGRTESNSLTHDELEKIRNVINKAKMLEETEQERVGSLVHHLNIMRQNSMGDGQATCILCAEQFGKFSRNAPIICMDCKKKVCNKCCVDYDTGQQHINGKQSSAQNLSMNWLCKICSENRELWKRSGAWFFQSLPTYKLPNFRHSDVDHIERRPQRRPYVPEVIDSPKMHRKDVLALPDSPVVGGKGHRRTVSAGSTGSFQWTKPSKIHLTSSSEFEESSSDDDGITLGKTNKPSNMQLRSIDTISLTSSTSATSTGQQSTGSSVSRRSSGRRTFRGKQQQKPEFPKVTVTDEYDTVSMDSGVTDRSVEDDKLMTDMSTLHGGSVSNEDAKSISGGKENRGNLEFSILYDPLKCALQVELIRAKNLIAMDANGLSDPYVKLHLLPGATRDKKADATKLRTKTKNKTLNPVFDETLTYLGVLEHELATRQLLLTVLDEDRFGHDFIGEVIVPLKSVVATQKKTYSLPLRSSYALKEKEKNPIDPGRLYLGLRYYTNEHYLSVRIHRCTSLVPKKNSNDNVNAFVKATLTMDDDRVFTQKTEVKKKTQNPVFDRELKFKVSPETGQADLARGSLLVSVMNKGQDVIGSVELSINSKDEALKQWYNCLKSKDQQFNSWHILSK
ncbi:rabphilin-3A-like isoform X1 [Styela clava]